jgi:hypothetical protein
VLIIRDRQMHAFDEQLVERFVAGLAAELHAEFPRRCAALTAEGVRAWIHHGIRRAAIYGINSHEAVGRYVRLMLVFGRDFDVHPTLPWVREHLLDPNADQDAKVNSLTRACRFYVEDLVEARGGR